MNFQQKHFTVKPLEFDLFCGMDVDKKSISVTFVSHEGFVKSLKIPYDSANLIQYVRQALSGQTDRICLRSRSNRIWSLR